MLLSQVRAFSQRTMYSRNRMDCCVRIRTSAANSSDKWVNARRPTTVHEGSYPTKINYNEYKMKVYYKERKNPWDRPRYPAKNPANYAINNKLVIWIILCLLIASFNFKSNKADWVKDTDIYGYTAFFQIL